MYNVHTYSMYILSHNVLIVKQIIVAIAYMYT